LRPNFGKQGPEVALGKKNDSLEVRQAAKQQ
jgi:hypothetical protein